MEKKSRVLIVGATGKLGHELAKASLNFSHPTFALVRDSAFADPDKLVKLHSLSDAGVTLLKGSLQDEESLIEAIKKVDVVICAVNSAQRFIPSEFGLDPDKVQISGMDYNFYSRKAEIRRLVEAEGIPYTFISCNPFMSCLLPSLVQPELKAPPRDEIKIYGDGNKKGVFVKECDVAAFTISTLDDPRTLNKVLYLRPSGNVYSMNELADIWETKITKKLRRLYISEEQLLHKIRETPYPDNMVFVFIYSVFIKGDQTYFDIDSSGGLEGTQLYPHLKYTTINEYLDTLV
ncbi:probable pinoresinol-lariciresinol reductase 3 isoform X2 [Rhodamnia argentea]|uniref:Probable pinoresinol-lariciresinol reductase 3 isoform X2 n=1 Tax=Rhodamnia argentea TaxID=178133 RepID=A0A8B8NR82_9MYRT|nr:probable pinoresinol-lariciresinol reductase 3 isoform X2 [Rhodamnia argentea]